METPKTSSEALEGYTFTLGTTYFKGYQSWMGTPVRISNGAPRFKVAEPVKYKVPLLFPNWNDVKDKSLSVRDFRLRYWRGLDAVGVDNIADVLQALYDDGGRRNLALLCYEKHPRDCHRGDFAMWWKDRTGISIPELTH